MPRGSRVALCCLALLLTLALLIKGRVPAERGSAALSFAPAPGKVLVRISGDLPRPGMYAFPDGTTPRAAIIMTVGDLPPLAPETGTACAPLVSGDALDIKVVPGKNTVISRGKMTVQERMLLAVPLDPDRLSAEEWDLLPGIGPALAARIVADRQKNGAFGSLEGVSRVPGVGYRKVHSLRKYF